MTPIDDELRDLLHGRADRLPPPRDPLAGIETRARAIRRRRVAAAAASTALAVGAVAIAVPLAGTVLRDPGRPPTPASPAATATAATPAPVPAVARPAAALRWSRLRPATGADRAALVPVFRIWSTPSGLADDDVVVEDLGGVTYEKARFRVVQAWGAGQGPVVLATRQLPGGRVELVDQAVPSPDLPVVTVSLPLRRRVVLAAFTESGDTELAVRRAGSSEQPFERLRRTPYVRLVALADLPEGDVVTVTMRGRTATLPVTLGVDHHAGSSGQGYLVGWPQRGDAAPDEVRAAARTAWHAAHPGPGLTDYPLWYGLLPTGQAAYVAQLVVDGVRPRVVVWQGVPGDRGFLVRDDASPAGLVAVTALLMGSDGPYVLVVGSPETTRIRYAPQGTRFTALPAVDGVAVFLQRGDTPGTARVRLVDRAGRRLVETGVDAGPVGSPS